MFNFLKRSKAVHNRPACVSDVDTFSGRQKAAQILFDIHEELCFFYLIDPLKTNAIRAIRDYAQGVEITNVMISFMFDELLRDFYPRQGMHSFLLSLNDVPESELERRRCNNGVMFALDTLFEKDAETFGLKIPK